MQNLVPSSNVKRCIDDAQNEIKMETTQVDMVPRSEMEEVIRRCKELVLKMQRQIAMLTENRSNTNKIQRLSMQLLLMIIPEFYPDDDKINVDDCILSVEVKRDQYKIEDNILLLVIESKLVGTAKHSWNAQSRHLRSWEQIRTGLSNTFVVRSTPLTVIKQLLAPNEIRGKPCVIFSRKWRQCQWIRLKSKT